MRPRLLDLFCGAGGAAVGYHRAGFDVIGVDIKPQPRYPFKFHEADALTYPLDGFEAIHASPPCQARTTMSNRWRGAGGLADQRVDLLQPMWTRLDDCTVPVVIENVLGKHIDALPLPWIKLHGGMFDLGVHRPRLFWSNRLLLEPGRPAQVADPVGVYGKHHDGRRLFTRTDGTEQRAPATLTAAHAAMGIDWMTWRELAESIPPAYTQFIGQQLLAHLAVPA
jgi:DNA (cytosine-5)-methyltransferase 1